MSKVIKLKKGLDIYLKGTAQKVTSTAASSELYAMVMSDYIGVTPKPLVKEGEQVQVGTPIFFDKENPTIIFTSPVSGTLKEIVRGEKRKILAITITPDNRNESIEFDVPRNPTSTQAQEFLQNTGLWAMIIQRPFGIIARPNVAPREIYVSAFDSSPLAPDMDYVLKDQQMAIETAIAFLSPIAPVHMGTSTKTTRPEYRGVGETTAFAGKHPIGNVGTQIANTRPINKGEVVWTIDIQHLAMIGRTLLAGKLDMHKTIALAGTHVARPQYVKCISGASIASITRGNIEGDNIRYISGNPLTGTNAGAGGYLGFYHNQVTLITEGDNAEFIGWIMPRFHKLSTSRSYFSWLCPKKEYALDTNLNGGERALVMTGEYEKVIPMDIYPVYLLKAVMCMDIDKMENLGIYEVIEEDLALCEFICPSKIEWQSILREGITKMIKEL